MSAIQWTDVERDNRPNMTRTAIAITQHIVLWGSAAAFIVGVNVTLLYALLFMTTIIE